VRVLVTGATSGIGALAAQELEARGAEVVVHGRDPERLAASRVGVQRVRADLTVRAEVRRLAREVGRVDVLANNAGAVFGERMETPDGFERTWALNHLAGFELARLLAPPRVVAVSSSAHKRARLDWDDLGGERGFRGWTAYKRSKLANVLHVRALAARGVLALALDPGVVRSRFGTEVTGDPRLAARLTGQGRSDPAVPARTLASLCLDAEWEAHPGAYVVRGKPGAPDPAARDDASAQRLWEVSEAQVGG